MVADKLSMGAGGVFLCLGLALQPCAANNTGSRFRGTGEAGAQSVMIGMGIVETSAMPKNEMGRLAPRSVRHMVHSFFAKEHGWLIQGLEPHGMQTNVTEIHDVLILQDKVPALVETLLEARQSGHGLSLSDIVAMVAALQRLIFDESVGLLEASYYLNSLAPSQHLEEEALHEVLTSYLLIFEMGARGNLSDPRLHQAVKAKITQMDSWQTLVEFEQDAVWNYLYRHRSYVNPFVSEKFNFEAASEIVEDMAQDYGKWQNSECQQMKDNLLSLDSDGSGLVPLSTFYSQPDTADYQFTESVDYLRDIGAIDMSTSSGRPKVRIANYLAGPSNCIASHTYYSVCCLSECEAWMNQIEGQVQAPTASPEHLLELVGTLSSFEHDLQRITPQLRQRLHTIGQQHDGQVPLHGRLFAQWLHYAFPQDCPYPHMVEDAAVLTPGHWTYSDKKVTSVDERQMHAQQAKQEVSAVSEPSGHQWSHVEVLPLMEVEKKLERSAVAKAMRVVMQLLMFLVVIRTAVAGWQAATSAAKGQACSWKKTDDSLPF